MKKLFRDLELKEFFNLCESSECSKCIIQECKPARWSCRMTFDYIRQHTHLTTEEKLKLFKLMTEEVDVFDGLPRLERDKDIDEKMNSIYGVDSMEKEENENGTEDVDLF